LDVGFCHSSDKNTETPFGTLVADCGGSNPEVNCPCCTECCSESGTCDLKICAEVLEKVIFEHKAAVRNNTARNGTICECEPGGRVMSCVNPECEVCANDRDVCATRVDFGFIFNSTELTEAATARAVIRDATSMSTVMTTTTENSTTTRMTNLMGNRKDQHYGDWRCNMRYTRGRDELVSFQHIVRPTWDGNSTYSECTVSIDGEKCNRCELVQCENDSTNPSTWTTRIRLNCKNVNSNAEIDDPCDRTDTGLEGTVLEVFNTDFLNGDNNNQCRPCFFDW
jgi:hypothetical protein